MGRPKPDRDRSHLYPRFADEVRVLERALEREGLPFRFYEGFRGHARQSSGYARGKSKARFGQSWHNYGMAADFVGRVDGRWSWDNALPWRAYGEAAESVGLSWSGRWRRFRELVHVQHRRYELRHLRLAQHVEDSIRDEGWAEYVAHWWSRMEGYGPGIACRQRLLHLVGEDPGPVDGYDGPRTRAATLEVVDGDLGHRHLAAVRAELIARVVSL